MVDQDQDILNRQSDIYLDIDAIKEAGVRLSDGSLEDFKTKAINPPQAARAAE